MERDTGVEAMAVEYEVTMANTSGMGVHAVVKGIHLTLPIPKTVSNSGAVRRLNVVDVGWDK